MISRNRKCITIALALAGMVIMIFYSFCTGSCDYLAGNFLGMDLKYVGIGFMAVLMVAALLNLSAIVRIMLAMALGGKIYLVGYQVSVDTYCSYCLSFGLLILAAFLIHHDPVDTVRRWRRIMYRTDNRERETLKKEEERMIKRREALHQASKTRATAEQGGLKGILVVLFILLGFLLMWGGFTGSDNLVFAGERYPSFGKGNVEVRMYSNYFCGPCFRLKPQIEPLLDTLVKENRIRLLFIDMPFDRISWEYNRYYLYAVREDPSFENALRFRTALFEAADSGIETEKNLQSYLQRLGREPTGSDISSDLRAARQYIRDDGITSTPTVVIEKDGTTVVYKGIDEIEDALRTIHE